MQCKAQAMNVTSGMPVGTCANMYLLKPWEPRPDCCQIAGHRSKEVEIVGADQPVREVSCGVEEAWQCWKGTQAREELPALFFFFSFFLREHEI